MDDNQKLQQDLGYFFKNLKYLEEALTHSSYLKNKHLDIKSNERLEFFGDRVLGLVLTEYLFLNYDYKEGILAEYIAYLTSRDVLHLIAINLKLENNIKFIGIENIDKQKNILADCFEAIIASIYLDGGLESAKNFILSIWVPYISNYAEQSNKKFNPKSYIQEWLQRQKKSLPVYKELEKQGKDHNPIFIISLEVDGFEPILAEGKSKKSAEKLAAEKFIENHIQNED
jgi:ribonuclease-3